MDRQAQRAIVRAALAAVPRERGSVASERESFEAFAAARPPDPRLVRDEVTLGGRPAVRLRADGDGPVLLYLHGGGYVVGSGRTGAGLAGALAVRTGGVAYSLDYRLAPEHVHPHGVEDALAAYRELVAGGGDVVVAGDSAGGGLAVSLLIEAREAGLAQPRAAVVFSPWVDLTLAGESMRTRDGVDPLFTVESLRWYAIKYAPGREKEASPLFADLSRIAPLLIQVGNDEVLLDDAVRLAAKVAADGGTVRLEVGAGLPHVYQNNFGRLDDADDALDRAARFVGEPG
ncbi:alpha/beta hydrolase [Actinoplanes sp. CA-030573]|uniref:alpha/beta hydrolase n=1 Tax=Actinoplanes sp. CA-030573 TaxID=3239898 RepID=UPI003D8A4F57